MIPIPSCGLCINFYSHNIFKGVNGALRIAILVTNVSSTYSIPSYALPSTLYVQYGTGGGDSKSGMKGKEKERGHRERGGPKIGLACNGWREGNVQSTHGTLWKCTVPTIVVQ